jgi:RNA polymerase sigma-70 factor (ECF subfamily)
MAKTVRPTVPLPTDDALLVQRIAAQDRQAFDTFYAQYAPRLRGYLARLLSDQTLVDEVSNDVMLVVWQQAARFPATVSLWAWLCGIARHKARTAWARSASHAMAPAGYPECYPETPENILLRQEYARRFTRALDALPFYERTALALLVQHGCAYPDIAALMDTPVSTVRTRVSRACQRLRAHVAALDHPPS